ncbi:MAG: DUF6655 family protein [Tepidisphaeraceae bacterium]
MNFPSLVDSDRSVYSPVQLRVRVFQSLFPASFIASACVLLLGGCASIRVTDPPRSATEQYLESEALERAVAQLSMDALRDRVVFVDPEYLYGFQERNAVQETQYLVGEVRAKALASGVRLVDKKEDAQIIMELRSLGVGVDRTEFLLGIPALYLPSLSQTAGVPAATPELAIVKRTTQKGFGSVAYVAYWNKTGDLVAQSGPMHGKTMRQDYWFLGIGPSTVGNIVPTEP